MIYVWLASWKPGLAREQMDGALQRRAGWSYPEGLRVLGGYWPAGNAPAVVSIFEADEFAPIMAINLD